MRARQVELTEHFDDYVERGVISGRFRDVSEVVGEGLRLLEQRDREDEAKLTRLREAVREGFEAVERGEYLAFSTQEEIHAHVRGLGEAARMES